MKVLLCAALLAVSLPATAQVNKCKGPDGKTIYSDTACDTPDKMQRIRTDSNTIDASGDRRSASAMKAESELNALMSNPPEECRFEGKSGKRLELAQRAKQECVRNVVAERTGGRTSTTSTRAYQENEAHRRRLIEAAAASGGRRTITCMGMGPGMVTCK